MLPHNREAAVDLVERLVVMALDNQPVGLRLKPVWRQDERALYYDGVLVKKFVQPAKNQELILVSFEDQGWPDYIDDPLVPDRRTNPKRRLHYAIQSLNRCRAKPLIRFGGDGTGTRIRWWPAGRRRSPIDRP